MNDQEPTVTVSVDELKALALHVATDNLSPAIQKIAIESAATALAQFADAIEDADIAIYPEHLYPVAMRVTKLIADNARVRADSLRNRSV